MALPHCQSSLTRKRFVIPSPAQVRHYVDSISADANLGTQQRLNASEMKATALNDNEEPSVRQNADGAIFEGRPL